MMNYLSILSLRATWLTLTLLLLAFGCDTSGSSDGNGRIYSGGQVYGAAVALDGDRAVVGAFGSDDAFVLLHSGDGWGTEDRLSPPPGLPNDNRGVDAYFGQAVDIDGDVAVVSALVSGVAARNVPGRAFVFEHAGGVWTRTADLQLEGPPRAFSESVAVSSGRVAASASAETVPITEELVSPAAIVIYERSGAGWAETSRIEETEYEKGTGLGGPSSFGSGLALDGDRAAVGSPGQTVEGIRDAGVVRVFERSGAGWTLSASLSPPSPRTNDRMGAKIALDGPILAASAEGRSLDGAVGGGSAFVFEQSGGGWAAGTELRPSSLTPADSYGRSIAVSGDRVAVGAIGRAQGRGSVFVWVHRASGAWEQEVELWPDGLGPGSLFGESVALDGDHLLVGAIADEDGAVYAFRRGSGGWVPD
ncbi:FG-GAP repeat protein [Rubrivirga litoralis]|uniref:FG-GAP repeat protein n=1 Tax=Rubrivirga litoralis TaxID=3075598 RepID=A0ABU3BV80_9BACT|nr:FG-GAP repeat protein [Rubrivirga sp. F394]MDT0633193.1 FG-GAP repeat protein [Rubrivirga sp. F394]